jgi:hypothetical protein
MATAGQVITKASVINDYLNRIKTVYFSANTGGRRNFSTLLTHQIFIRMWDNGTIIGTGTNMAPALPYGPPTYTDPSVADLPTQRITASEIINMCRAYTASLTRFRKNIIVGLYYSQWDNASGLLQTINTVPLDFQWPTQVGFSGTFGFEVVNIHLNSNFTVALPSPTPSQPTAGSIINASVLNSFYDNLRLAADNTANPFQFDIRSCHSSCHNNCHGSRGRR